MGTAADRPSDSGLDGDQTLSLWLEAGREGSVEGSLERIRHALLSRAQGLAWAETLLIRTRVIPFQDSRTEAHSIPQCAGILPGSPRVIALRKPPVSAEPLTTLALLALFPRSIADFNVPEGRWWPARLESLPPRT